MARSPVAAGSLPYLRIVVSDMSKERKYQNHEIRQILDLAIGQEDGPAQSPPAVDGLTLL